MSGWPTCARARPRRERCAGGGRPAGVPRSARHPVRHQPRLQPGPDPAAAGGGRRAGRDQPAVGAYGRRRSPPSRWRRWASTCSSGSTPSRTGRPGAGRCWPTSRSACSACRSWPAAGSPTAGSTRPRPGRSSSGPRWSRDSGGPGTPSSPANQELRAEVEALEERTRRRDLLVDDETVIAFYAARVPEGIISAAHFDTWWKQARQQEPGPAHHDLGRPDHRRQPTADVGVPGRPGGWRAMTSTLDYVFEPGQPDDGVTVGCRCPC